MPAPSRCPVVVPAGQSLALARCSPQLIARLPLVCWAPAAPKRNGLPPLHSKTNTHPSRCHFHAFCVSLSHPHCTALHCSGACALPERGTLRACDPNHVRLELQWDTSLLLLHASRGRGLLGGHYPHHLRLPAAYPTHLQSPSTATLCASLQLRYPSLNHAHSFAPAVRAFPAPAPQGHNRRPPAQTAAQRCRLLFSSCASAHTHPPLAAKTCRRPPSLRASASRSRETSKAWQAGVSDAHCALA
ncbi:hypothetical protein COCC4DRAFT_135468 [Bipolaris maydis ATCC 48331]|uniref:Uncharacterized protein n=2 Tax=Cochliobolus heterostrophus TaxID=5016 RepID=M2UE70_COCH5|nr:uncharacterized protein COCC4DRAFT_135468 [Bipolaris maydis ATCC 48331]EMD86192.1 hypothetical protein COCHEDRAFT_1034654 [Bipolaris maydis C5]ENI06141.1 hypothetical protein COCC4DRAFT_135468 [Bipolaris maydis ATCC 48331]KAJ6213827.1 hypothetical protein PSV09DRAFT_1034654 [Bipolaris maydis]